MLKEHWECGSCKLGLPSLFSAHFCFFPSHRSLYLVNSTDETECEKCEVARPEENQEALDIIEEEEEVDESHLLMFDLGRIKMQSNCSTSWRIRWKA